jgi:hypothetical protein
MIFAYYYACNYSGVLVLRYQYADYYSGVPVRWFLLWRTTVEVGV